MYLGTLAFSDISSSLWESSRLELPLHTTWMGSQQRGEERRNRVLTPSLTPLEPAEPGVLWWSVPTLVPSVGCPDSFTSLMQGKAGLMPRQPEALSRAEGDSRCEALGLAQEELQRVRQNLKEQQPESRPGATGL